MDNKNLIYSLNDADFAELAGIDSMGYYAVDISEICFSDLSYDPWEALRAIRNRIKNTKLMLCLHGQSLLGRRHYADDAVDFFVAKAVENGIDILRIYDALGDPRNLERPVKAAKRCGAHAEVAMVYTESPVHSVSLFAGYAAQLASMGADSLCICGVSNEFTCRELVKSVKESVSIPISVSAQTEEISVIALDAGADKAEVYNNVAYSDEFFTEMGNIRADAGFPPLASPISDIIAEQAELNLRSCERYERVTDDFKLLVRGGYGRTPAPIAQDFVKKICGNEPLILVRPADMLAPELDLLREKTSGWLEQEEDVLTYALFEDEAVRFFENRKAKKYSLDLPHAKAEKGIHTV